MMIDLSTESVISLATAAREVPNRRGKRGVNVATTWRWAGRGVRGVRLETCMIGGIRMTSREALHRFFASVTAVANGDMVPPWATRTCGKEDDNADSVLDEALGKRAD